MPYDELTDDAPPTKVPKPLAAPGLWDFYDSGRRMLTSHVRPRIEIYLCAHNGGGSLGWWLGGSVVPRNPPSSMHLNQLKINLI